jgi:hypothetical protein
MTKKDFVAVARILKAQRSIEHPEYDPAIDNIVDDFCVLFSQYRSCHGSLENSRFNRNKFIEA